MVVSLFSTQGWQWMCTQHLCPLTTSADMTCWRGSTTLCISLTPRLNSSVQVRPEVIFSPEISCWGNNGATLDRNNEIDLLCLYVFKERRIASSWTCCFRGAFFWRRSNFKPSWSMNLYTTSKFFRQLLNGWVSTKSESLYYGFIIYFIHDTWDN